MSTIWASLMTEALKFLNGIFINPEKQLKKVNNIYDQMHSIVAETEAERFLILRSHNGGGIIKPSGELYVSVLYQDYMKPFKDVKEKYQKLPVDKEYAKMLLDVMQNKKVYYEVNQMNEGLLKSIYKNEGVRYAFIYYLGQDKKNIYFCSICTSKNLLGGWLNSNDELQMDLATNIIRQNIK